MGRTSFINVTCEMETVTNRGVVLQLPPFSTARVLLTSLNDTPFLTTKTGLGSYFGTW